MLSLLGRVSTRLSPTRICVFETVTTTPSSAGGVLTKLAGRRRSSLWGMLALDSPRLFSKNTRMIVMMSSIATMFRKFTSCSDAARRTALRSSAL
ncbi:hypothetical protein D3C83_55420 [compost metagenome]